MRRMNKTGILLSLMTLLSASLPAEVLCAQDTSIHVDLPVRLFAPPDVALFTIT